MGVGKRQVSGSASNLIYKRLMKPDTYFARKWVDGKPKAVAAPITEDRLRRWVDNFHAMTKAGLQIPVPWNHQPNAVPIEIDGPAPDSYQNAGFVRDALIDDDGWLKVGLEIPLEADRAKIGTTCREMSPEIRTQWPDGRNREWLDAMTHVALCVHPVADGQPNFELPESQPAPLALHLSLTPVTPETKEHFAMADDANYEGEVEVKDEAKLVEEPDPAAGSGDAARLGRLVKELAQDGYMVGADVSMDNLVDRLFVALATKRASKVIDDGSDVVDDVNPEVMADPEVMPMSLENNPVVKELTSRISRYEGRIQAQERANRQTKINGLFSSKRITAPMRDKLLASLGTFQFSLTDAGGVADNAIDDKIALLGELPEGAAFAINGVNPGPAEVIPVEHPTVGNRVSDPVSAADELIKRANAKYATKSL